MAIIALEGMRFFARHGVFEFEAEDGNDFEVDVWLDTGTRPLPESDDLADALDYGKIYDIAEEVMNDRVDLLETLVVRIGRRCLGEFEEVDSVRVRVSKMNPPVKGTTVRSYVEDVFRK